MAAQSKRFNLCAVPAGVAASMNAIARAKKRVK
jgi:hypothetical protein